MIGELLGSYRVVSKVGAGGMGIVYLAEHRLLGSRAAIKVVRGELSSPKTVQRFFDEARAATRIHDPGIVTVLDFGWHGNDAYIVMEFLIGETLTQRLGMGRIPPLQAVRLAQMCALAMAAAHARGIIHRDLKPDNIFVVTDPAVPGGERIKILDFGIAKLIDNDGDSSHLPTHAGAIMGTPAYMSPEQCHGAGEVDHLTDVYALGCVLFHILCGRPPFIAQTPGDMIAAQVRELPPRPSELVPELSPAIDALVLRCLEKVPAHRFSSMTELVRAGSMITGDNQHIPTIPPMQALPMTEGTSEPPVPQSPTTLTGSATSLALVVDDMPPHRPRYGMLAILLLGLAGGIVAAKLIGGDRRSLGVAPTAPIDAPVDAPVDAPSDVRLDAALARIDASTS